MKRCLINSIMCLLAVFLLLFGTIPCQAVERPAPPRLLASMEELLQWYGGLSGNTPQEGGVTKPIVSSGEVILGATPCRVDIVLLVGLRVPSGARLTIDNPNLALMGPPSAITVEPGGTLHIRRWYARTAEAMPQGGIVVQVGGTLLMDAGITLPDGVVIDQNPPPNTLPPPVPETPTPETPALEPPDETPPPETPPAEEKLSITGEVLKVSAQGSLLAMVTLPRVDPALTETIVIERSADARVWNTEYIFRWNEEALGFISDETPEFGRMVSKTRIDGSKTDFKYLARLSGKPFYLRVTETTTDGRQMVSNEIHLTEPPMGQYPSEDDYEDSGGNRGGGGQGATEREEQKKPEKSRSDSVVTTEPQMATRNLTGIGSAQAPPVSAAAPQETVLSEQDAAGQQTEQSAQQAALPISARAPEQNGQAVLSQSKPLGSIAQNWLVIATTLALCGAIWIFTVKRKKS